jgi:HEAT repeat protein
MSAISFEVGELRPYVVKVLRPNGRVSGTGFFCHPKGFVLTSRHVVNPILKKGRGLGGFWQWIGHFTGFKRKPSDKPALDKLCLAWGTARLEARFREELSPEKSDLAVLEVLNLPPSGMSDYPFLPLDISRRLQVGHRLESFGFPQGKEWSAQGIPVGGSLGGKDLTQLEGVGGLDDVWVFPLEGFNMDVVHGGFSGAPVLDRAIHKVVGLMVAKDRPHQAFLAPLVPIVELWEELRDIHDVRAAIRRTLRQKAEQELVSRLRNTSWVPLDLERGDPAKEHDDKSNLGRHGRRWSSLEAETLLRLSGKNVLSAEVGAGKTTLLRWLSLELLNKLDGALPLFMTCKETSKYEDFPSLRRRWVDKYKDQFLAEDLEYAFDGSRIWLLCDGLDQVEAPDYDYQSFAEHAFALAGDNPALISSRPSALLAIETNRDVIFLGLKPFSPAAQQAYFGEHLAEARRLAAFSKDLSEVPMLAFMVRELITKRQSRDIATRTELYARYLKYTVEEHDTNLPFARQNRSERDMIINALEVLAYRSLALDPPQIQRVNAGLYDTLQNEQSGGELPSSQKLTRFGFINLLVEHVGDALYFTHQSFQEFLAAQYLNEPGHESEIEKLMGELWNPKWAEVIRFLAGLKGESLIYQILTQADNVIHSNLFLAARYAHEASDSSMLREDVAKRLLPLADHPILFEDAIEGLGQLRDPLLISPLLASRNFRKQAAIKALAQFAEELDSTTVEALVGLLKDEVPSVRYAAADALTPIGQRLDSIAIASLVALLEDEDQDVRVTAAGALSRVGQRLDSAAIASLVALLTHKDWYVRKAAARVLEQVGQRLDPVAIAALVMLLKEEKCSSVCQAAAYALRQVGQRLDSAAIASLVALLKAEDYRVRVAAAEALGQVAQQLDSTAIAALVALLKNKEYNVRQAAIKALGQAGQRLDAAAIAPLVALLKDKEVEVRLAAADALGEAGQQLDSTAIASLVALLKDEEYSVWGAAAEALGAVGDHDAIAALFTLLKDENGFVRAKAASVLGRVGQRLDSAAIASLVALLNDKAWNVRAGAAEALGQVGQQLDSTAIAALVALLKNKENSVRKAAARALRQVGQRLDSAAIASLVALLKEGDYHVCQAAAEALGRVGQRLDSATITFLVALLKAEDYHVCHQAAAEALGQVGQQLDSTAIAALVALLKNKENSVRKAAAEALGQVAQQLDSTAIAALVALLKEKGYYVCQAAAKVLGQVGQRLDSSAIAALVALLKEKDYHVRRAAAEVLGQVKQRLDSAAIEALVALLKDEELEVRRAAAAALTQRRAAAAALTQVAQRLDSSAIAALVALLKDEELEVRRAAAPALTQRRAAAPALTQVGQRLDSSAIASLLALLKEKDYDVRQAAAEVLGQVGQRLDSSAIASLLALLKEKDYHVCQAAAEVLGQVGQGLDSATVASLVALLHDEDSPQDFVYALLKKLYQRGCRL